MNNGRPESVPPLHLAGLLNNVSPSQTLLQHRSIRWIAGLHEEMGFAIQPLIKLLKDVEWQARVGAASTLGNLAEQCKS